MSETWEEFEHAGCRIRIVQDDDATSPREWTNVGVMLAPLHRNYLLGDEQVKVEVPDYAPTEKALEHFNDKGRGGLFPRWAKCFYGATVVLPLYLLDHSGLAMRTGPFMEDPGGWDSGIVGFVFDTPHTRKETGIELATVEEALVSEVRVYDSYLQGSVCGYVVEALMDGACGHTDCDEHRDWEQIEDGSCWGFIITDTQADLEDVRVQAKAAAESYARELTEAHG